MIEEILDRLERIDHKEYCGGFEFADSATFEEMGRCFDERKQLANYTKELQQENKQLKEIVYNLTTMTVYGDRKQIKNTAQYKLEQLQKVLTELEEWLKEENTYSDYKDITYRETMGYVLDKIQELKEKYK